jgi:hypothetical protein
MTDPIEHLIRDTLTQHATLAPSASALTSRSNDRSNRRTRQWAIPVLASVAVIVITVATLVLSRGWAQHPVHAPSATAVTPTVSAPAGTQIISYHGVELTVPSPLPISTFQCGPFLRSTVFLDNAIGHSCPVASGKPGPAGLTTVALSAVRTVTNALAPQIIANTPVRIGTSAASIGYRTSAEGVEGVLVIPTTQTVIDVVTPTKADTQAILGSTRVVDVDTLGCRSKVNLATALPPNQSTTRLVSADPVSAVACEYQVGNNFQNYNDWLLLSKRLTPALGRQAATLANTLPSHEAAVSPGGGLHVLLTFTYQDGSTETLDATTYTSGDARLITNGQRTVEDVTGDLADLLAL